MTPRIVFAGTPQFAVPALRALLERFEVVGVLTQPDRPAGRGRVVTASPVKQFALSRSLPVAQPVTLRGDGADVRECHERLHHWRPDVMVVVAYGLILPASVLQLPPRGCLNIHASLLPRWRGAAPIQRAILAGDNSTGVCIMQMDEGLDTGPVLLSESVSIPAGCLASELHDTLALLGARLVVSAVSHLDELKPVPQPSQGVCYAEKLSKREAVIDWQCPAAQIDRQIRAFNPWPAAQAVYDGEPIKLLRSRLLPAQGSAPGPPGTVLGLRDGLLAVVCGQGILGLGELQRAGRKPVTAQDFANAERARIDSGQAAFQ